jgi:hypothetical protein
MLRSQGFGVGVINNNVSRMDMFRFDPRWYDWAYIMELRGVESP